MLSLLAIFLNASFSHILWNYSVGRHLEPAFPVSFLCTHL